MPKGTKRPTTKNDPDPTSTFEVIPRNTGNRIRYDRVALPVLPDPPPPTRKARGTSRQQRTASTHQPATPPTYSNHTTGPSAAAELPDFPHPELYEDEPNIERKNVCNLQRIRNHTHVCRHKLLTSMTG